MPENVHLNNNYIKQLFTCTLTSLCSLTQLSLSEEANHECYKAFCSGHRGVLMRLTKETDKAMAVEMLSNKHYH